MNKDNFLVPAIISAMFCFLYSCDQKTSRDKVSPDTTGTEIGDTVAMKNSLVKEGAYLVSLVQCAACHTPMIMTAKGPALDTTRLFAGGHPTLLSDVKGLPKGWITTDDEHNAFYGSWGTSFAANLTPDDTGIGNWSEAQFKKALVGGKFMGIDEERNILPPMRKFTNMSDHDVKAIFAYLKSLKPVHNSVPAHIPPGKY